MLDMGMIVLNNNESGFVDVKFVSLNNSSDVSRRKTKEELIKQRNELLISMGYTITNDGQIYSPKNSMLDGILGFVVGDVLGVPVEFVSRENLRKNPVKEMREFGTYNQPIGTWSDDTSMTLATMDSIIENGMINCEDIMFKFSEWMNNDKYTATDYLFDIGNTTERAISRFDNGIDIMSCGSKDEYSNGNGSLMRMLPIAYYLSLNNFSLEDEVQIINSVSSLTHAHEISCLGCKIYCDYVKQLLNGVSKEEAIDFIRKQKYELYYSKDVVDKYGRILNYDISKFKESEINSSGYVVDTLEASLWCTLNSNSYEEAVLMAVNLGKDTDTIGAITGSLNGIIYTRDKIPSNWLDKIKKRGYIEDLSLRLVNTLNNLKKERSR